ncbi:MAG: hypothetical protein HQL77_06825 [Magnetococcales bacterium]|nr:hypothetical protein [Magnetococcales bacterium]
MSETLFTQRYRRQLKEWVAFLGQHNGLILAISRKGPRLLEVLIAESLLDPSILQRVISERALPLIDHQRTELLIIDDLVSYGSTFQRIMAAAEIIFSGTNSRITGTPFAVGADVKANVKRNLAYWAKSLTRGQNAGFVHQLIQSFSMLGGPLDIEFPVVGFRNASFNPQLLDRVLNDFAQTQGGNLENISSKVARTADVAQMHKWTLPVQESGEPHQINKFRFFLSHDRKQLTMVCMAPRPWTFGELTTWRPSAQIEPLWHPVLHRVEETLARLESYDRSDKQVESHLAAKHLTQRSLVMWANYLLSLRKLKGAVAVLHEMLGDIFDETTLFGCDAKSLRYLLGPNQSIPVGINQEKFLTTWQNLQESVNEAGYARQPEVLLTKDHIPHEVRPEYNEKFDALAAKATNVDDLLRTVFHAQSICVERCFRDTANDPVTRLDFGVPLGHLEKIVEQRFPGTSHAILHHCLDRLVDNGAVVPRYVPVANDENVEVWLRLFRVGEESVERAVYALKMLHDKLSHALKKALENNDIKPTAHQKDLIRKGRVPSVLFEKFCTAVLLDNDWSRDLRSFVDLGNFKKGFHLYGARVECEFEPGKPTVLQEWARKREFLIFEGGSRDDGVALGNIILDNYADENSPWLSDRNLVNAVNDVAEVFARFFGSGNPVLTRAPVTLTTTAKLGDYTNAIQAELNLWLYDPHSSISRTLDEMGKLEPDALGKYPSDNLNRSNDFLERTSRYTAEAKRKGECWEGRKETVDTVEKLIRPHVHLERQWHDFFESFNENYVKESETSGAFAGLIHFQKALNIAHRVNSTLRSLLNVAGFPLPEGKGKKTLVCNLEDLKKLIHEAKAADAIVGETINPSVNGRTLTKNLDVLLEGLKGSPEQPKFAELYPQIREMVLRITRGCDQLLRIYGAEQYKEPPRQLSVPRFILMWDVCGSTQVAARAELERQIRETNGKIQRFIENNCSEKDAFLGFKPDSVDDSNFLVTQNFKQALAIFSILSGAMKLKPIRAGCDVNVQGELNHYEKSGTLGGRALEYPARLRDYFRETGKKREEPTGSFLLVGEFARRYAQKDEQWPKTTHDSEWQQDVIDESYTPRIQGSLPIQITMITKR